MANAKSLKKHITDMIVQTLVNQDITRPKDNFIVIRFPQPDKGPIYIEVIVKERI